MLVFRLWSLMNETCFWIYLMTNIWTNGFVEQIANVEITALDIWIMFWIFKRFDDLILQPSYPYKFWYSNNSVKSNSHPWKLLFVKNVWNLKNLWWKFLIIFGQDDMLLFCVMMRLKVKLLLKILFFPHFLKIGRIILITMQLFYRQF